MRLCVEFRLPAIDPCHAMNSAVLKKFSWAGVATACLAAALILFFCDPVRVPVYPHCLFHQATGLDCPGCGSLRAMHALLHGHFAAALRFNAFVVLSLPLFAWLGFDFCRRKKIQEPALQLRPVWLWLYLTAFATFGIVRDLLGPWFAP